MMFKMAYNKILDWVCFYKSGSIRMDNVIPNRAARPSPDFDVIEAIVLEHLGGVRALGVLNVKARN
jgi:hypothetical protein